MGKLKSHLLKYLSFREQESKHMTRKEKKWLNMTIIASCVAIFILMYSIFNVTNSDLKIILSLLQMFTLFFLYDKFVLFFLTIKLKYKGNKKLETQK